VIVTFGLCATFIVSATSLVIGAVLFPIGPVTLLSGATVSLAEGLLRLFFVSLYVGAAMAALAAIGPYLPTHWWLGFASLLRAPVDTYTLLHGLLSFGVYLVLFGSFAWAR